MENYEAEIPKTQSSLSHQLCDFARQCISGLYYTTSVVGYDSRHEPISDFLRNKFKEGWVRGELKCERDLPLPGEDGFKEIEYVLGYIPGQSILGCPSQSSTYQYLYKEAQNSVSIVVLHNVSTIILETNEHEIHQYPVPYSWFDLSKRESYASSTSGGLIEICRKFNNKPIKIHTLLRSEQSTSRSVKGHFAYAQILISADQQSIAVKVIDPSFDPEQPYVNTVFGSLDPLSCQSERMFKRVADNLGISQFQHTYHYRADQVFNFHDCGLFSIGYLLSEMEGSDALGLSNYDMYQCFKILETDSYHEFHETKAQTLLPIPCVQSWFSYVVGEPRRVICDFILNNLL